LTLEVASSAFLDGYRAALEEDRDVRALLDRLLHVDISRRPFAFEGGAMGCRVLDARSDGGRTAELMEQADPKWAPLIRIGIGCGLARLGTEPPDDPLTLDGFGFQVGITTGPARSGTELRASHAERGRGRALWFVTNGRPEGCRRAIDGTRHAASLWEGTGVACAFAGDPHHAAERLLVSARGFEDAVRHGVAEAVALWSAVAGQVPDRTRDVARAIG